MPKSVPADSLLDSDSICDRADDIAQNRLSPIWMASAMMLVGEYPVIGFAIPAAVSPLIECLGEDWMDWDRLLRSFGLALADDAISDRSCHVHGALGKVDI